MSFGLRDQDWVDPPEEQPVICRDCRNWTECPCGCGYGWCREYKEHTHETDDCA